MELFHLQVITVHQTHLTICCTLAQVAIIVLRIQLPPLKTLAPLEPSTQIQSRRTPVLVYCVQEDNTVVEQDYLHLLATAGENTTELPHHCFNFIVFLSVAFP